MKLNWEAWAYGLFSGFIGGGASAICTGAAQAITDPQHTSVHHMFVLMGTSFLLAGAFTAAAFLAKSPLPAIEQTTVVQTTTQPSSAPQTTTTVVKTGPEPKP